MKYIKQLLASFLLTWVYTCAIVMWMATVQIFPGELTVTPWDEIEFTVHVPQEKSDQNTAFQRYIDGKELPGMETSSLSLSWTEYLTYFPEDEVDRATRFVSVAVTTSNWATTVDNATLFVEHAYEIGYHWQEMVPVCIDIEASCLAST